MQIEELQKQWQLLDDKLDRSLRINRELLRKSVVGSARGRLARWMVWPSIDIAASVFVAIFTIAFATDHWATLSLMLPASLMMAVAVALGLSSAHQLAILSAIDWAGPVVSIQRSLTALHVVQSRQVYWILLTSPISGFCGFILVFQWLLDFLPEPHFILEKLNGLWLWSNVVFGITFVVLGYFAIRFLSSRYRNRSWWKKVEDSLAGRTVVLARAELDQWIGLDDSHLN